MWFNVVLLQAAALLVLCSLIGTEAQTLVKPKDGTGLHMYFQTGWTASYIHYNLGSGWTTAPGVKMSASVSADFPSANGWFSYDIPAPAASLEFVFTNGNGVWDNNGNKNYKVTAAGTYTLISTVSPPLKPTPAPTPKPTFAPAPTVAPTPVAVGTTLVAGDNGTGVYIYFQCSWTAPYIHYNVGSAWTTPPGFKMLASTNSSFPSGLGWFYMHFDAPANYLEFTFNNGNGAWDNNGGKNYKLISAGTWTVVSSVSLPPTTTPVPTSASPTPTGTATPTPTGTTTPIPTGSCSNYNGMDSCTSGTQTDYPDSDDTRKWQTPPRNATGWSKNFQDYRSVPTVP